MKHAFAVVAPCMVGLFLSSAVRGADPAVAPAKPSAAAGASEAAKATPSFEEVPLLRLGGRAPLPAYLKTSATTLAEEGGINAKGDVRTAASDFVNRDFTFDVVYRSQRVEVSVFNAGIGSSDGQAYMRLHGPGHGGAIGLNITGQPEHHLGKTGDHAGPHLIRIEKRGKALTASLCVAFDGKTFEPTFSKTVPDLSAALPALKRHNSPLFVGGGNGATIEAVRLIIDGKPAPAGAAGEAPAAAPEAEWPGDDAPLFKLAGRAGLPSYLKASGTPLATGKGMAAEEFRTSITRLLDRDFTFDTVLSFKNDDEQAILIIGLGSPGGAGGSIRETVFSRVHGPGHGSQCTFNVAGQPEQELGRLSRSAGPHLFRIEKRGKTLTMAISPDFDGKFDPVAVKTLPDLTAAAPGLSSRDGVVVIKGATTIEAVRLWIDGKPVGTGKAPAVIAKAPGQPLPSPGRAATTAPASQGSTQATAEIQETEPPSPADANAPAAKVKRRQTSIRGLTVSHTDTGGMVGGALDIVLTATPGEARSDAPVTFVTPVGNQMKLVLDDVLRCVHIRYPVWEAEKVELTFDDRVSKIDGSSIGAAVGTMILSMLEGFEIDQNLAMTGDVTANGRVSAIGGVVAKIRAATGSGAAIVTLPADNFNQVADGLVYEGPTLLSNIQVIGIATLDDAAAAARVDRAPKLAEAVKLFAEVQASLKKSPGELKGKPVREKLTQVVALAPNHQSAQLLLLASQDKQPRRLSPSASLYYMAVAIRGVMPALQQQAFAMDRQRVPPVAVKEGLKSLDRLRWIADPTMQPLVDAYRDFIRAVSDAQSGSGSLATVRAKARAVNDAEAKVHANRDVMEKMLKEGV